MTLKREATPPDRPAEWFARCDITTPTTGWRRVLIYGGLQQCQVHTHKTGLLKDVIEDLRALGWYVSDDGELVYCPDHHTEHLRSH